MERKETKFEKILFFIPDIKLNAVGSPNKEETQMNNPMKKQFRSRKTTLTMKSILISLAALTFTLVKAEEGNAFYECLPGLPLSGGGE